jgi:hypothetical protein
MIFMIMVSPRTATDMPQKEAYENSILEDAGSW